MNKHLNLTITILRNDKEAKSSFIEYVDRGLFNIESLLVIPTYYEYLVTTSYKLEETLLSAIESMQAVGIITKTRESISERSKEFFFSKNDINFVINKGLADQQLINEILTDISLLYRLNGGSGINYSIERIHSLEEINV